MPNEHDFSVFPDRLRQALKEQNLTQAQAAQLLGISKHSFTRYLKGRVPCSVILFKMSRLFGKPMEWFLTRWK